MTDDPRTEHGWCAKCFADMGLVDDVLAREECWCPKCGAAIVNGDDWLSDCGMRDRKIATEHDWHAAQRDGLIR